LNEPAIFSFVRFFVMNSEPYSSPPAPDPLVLIVDDDASVRAAITKVLQEAGCVVRSVADGRQGLRQLEQQEFQLLVLDLDLPEISGWDVLDFAGAHRPLMAVLILTGFSSQCAPGSLLGADAVMEKPPDVNRLLRTIQLLLREPVDARLRRRSQGPIGAGHARAGAIEDRALL
jgi:DNA-binding response OmpR family regulator